MVAKKIATMQRGNQPNPPFGGFEPPQISQADAAKLMNVSERSVQRASSDAGALRHWRLLLLQVFCFRSGSRHP